MAVSWVSTTRKEILLSHKVSYNTSTGKDRRTTLETIKAELKASSGRILPKKLGHAIEMWYEAEGQGSEELPPRLFTKKWSVRRVVEQKMRPEIEEKIGEVAGCRSYLAKYCAACTEVCDGLSDERRDHFKRLAEEWNATKPPLDVQMRQAKKSLGTTIASFVREMENEMGAKVVLYISWRDKEEGLKGTWQEADKGNEGSFSSQRKAPHKKFLSEFCAWAEDELDDSAADHDDERPGKKLVKGEKKPSWPLEEDENGRAMLPLFDKKPKLAQMKEIIRAFMTHAYRHFTNNENVSVPWSDMITAESLWFASQTWNDEVPLIDPSHMKAKDIDALYDHWARRQVNGKEVVFGFVEALEKHKREKLKVTKKAKTTKKTKWMVPENDSEEEPSIRRIKGDPQPVASSSNHHEIQPRASGSGEKRRREQKVQIDEEESGTEEEDIRRKATVSDADGDEPPQEVLGMVSKKGKEKERPLMVVKKVAAVKQEKQEGDSKHKKRKVEVGPGLLTRSTARATSRKTAKK